ncbi:hypothetical protein I7Z51_002407 [Vibrio parahaemolyticus]|uniref:hypothetical protein n=1 Tax=Vibrio TaxID=662 RepID=UPI001A906D84|nr:MULTISPECIES: hypothetical protein [Vibrio]EGQ7973485.1 hypothetical protein [Vibrio parahaemolyticus]MBO0208613.1 hypothetical protein [Vibrio sp. Vb0877]MCR9810924.1 hypothetical protein [Vibrio parahaemolyticus]
MQIVKSNITAISLLAALVMAGCSSSPVEEYQEQLQQDKEVKYSKEEKKFNSVPSWFLNAPKNDEQGIYAVGTATSNNLQFSMNHAKLNAEFTMAKAMSQEVSGRERAFMRAGSNGNVESDSESVVTKFVDSADIVGVDTVKNEVVLIDDKYTVYTLLHLSYENQANILSRKAGDTTQATAAKAYEEVEAEVRRRAAERHQLEVDKAAAAAKAKAEVEAEVNAKAAATAAKQAQAEKAAHSNELTSSASSLIQTVESKI